MIRTPLVLALLLVLPGAAFAANAVVGTGIPASCTEAALNAGIATVNAGGGTLTFDCGPEFHILGLTTEKTLQNGVTVDGGGRIALSGAGVTRIFRLAAGAYAILRDLDLRIGFAAVGGGCVELPGGGAPPTRLDLLRVTFRACQALNFGGAIAAVNAVMDIRDSHFLDNVAEGAGGGAISGNDLDAVIVNSHFYGNQSHGEGGALQLWFSSVLVNDSFFADNEIVDGAGAERGGAIYLRESFFNGNNDVFLRNFGNEGGGAVAVIAGSSLHIRDATFEGNSTATNWEGGAALVETGSAFETDRSVFADNTARAGGAIFGNGTVRLYNTTLSGNTATASGGGIALFGAATLEMVNVTLVDNVVTTGGTQMRWTSSVGVAGRNVLFGRVATAAGADCSGDSAASFTNSVFFSGCGSAGVNGNVQGLPSLQPLQLACGHTAAHPFSSAASLGVDDGSCSGIDTFYDQRLVPRVTGAFCDIGAIEHKPDCVASFFADGFESGSLAGWSASFP